MGFSVLMPVWCLAVGEGRVAIVERPPFKPLSEWKFEPKENWRMLSKPTPLIIDPLLANFSDEGTHIEAEAMCVVYPASALIDDATAFQPLSNWVQYGR